MGVRDDRMEGDVRLPMVMIAELWPLSTEHCRYGLAQLRLVLSAFPQTDSKSPLISKFSLSS